MSSKIALSVLMLVVLILPAVVVAADDTTNQVSESNKFLSAEVTRQMKAMQQEVTQDLKDYQDENFKLLDNRMVFLMDDVKWRVTLGAIGASMVAMALVAFFMIRSIKHYSFEMYQERLLKLQQEREEKGMPMQQAAPMQQQPSYLAPQGMDEMQQKEWNPQVSNPTMSTQFGLDFSSKGTQMNNWQMQPAYDGSWKSPEEAVPYTFTEDPMDSPGWTPPEQESWTFGEEDRHDR